VVVRRSDSRIAAVDQHRPAWGQLGSEPCCGTRSSASTNRCSSPQEVRVPLQRRRRLRVSELRADAGDRRTAVEQQGGVGVSAVVESERCQPCPLQRAGEVHVRLSGRLCSASGASPAFGASVN
jgi:hypothetical protein